MEYKVNDVKLLKYLIVVVLIVLSALIFILTKQTKISTNIEERIAENIASTGWPEDVPIILNEAVDIQKFFNSEDPEYIVWTVDIEKGVSYTDFREYLIELDDYGFKAVKELGCKSPHLLVSNPTMDEDFYVIWNGKTDDYGVDVSWKNINEEENSQKENKEHVFSITLRTIRKDSSSGLSSGELIDDEHENLSSGDFVSPSGESLVSGEEILSGDVEITDISGDVLE